MNANIFKYDTSITKERSFHIKAFAILLMLIHHLFTFSNRLPEGGYISLFSLQGLTIEQFLGGFGKVCVCIFLFLSGYGLYISYYQKEITVNSIVQLIFKFYLQFWGVFIIFIPLGILLDKITFNLRDILLNALGIVSTLNGEWWFIYLYVLLVLLFPVLLKIVKHVNGGLIISASLVLVSVSNSINGYYLKQFLIYQVYFVMGLLVCRYSIFDRLNLLLKKVKGIKWINFGVLLCSPIIYIILLKLPIIYHFTFVIVTFILVYCIAQLPLDSGLLNWIRKISIWIGKNSTNIWLTHSFFCYYYFKKFIYSPRYSILIVMWLLFISLIVSEGLNWIMRSSNKLINKIGINTLFRFKKECVN